MSGDTHGNSLLMDPFIRSSNNEGLVASTFMYGGNNDPQFVDFCRSLKELNLPDSRITFRSFDPIWKTGIIGDTDRLGFSGDVVRVLDETGIEFDPDQKKEYPLEIFRVAFTHSKQKYIETDILFYVLTRSN